MLILLSKYHHGFSSGEKLANYYIEHPEEKEFIYDFIKLLSFPEFSEKFRTAKSMLEDSVQQQPTTHPFSEWGRDPLPFTPKTHQNL